MPYQNSQYFKNIIYTSKIHPRNSRLGQHVEINKSGMPH